MCIRTAGDDAELTRRQLAGQGFCVFENLADVIPELLCRGFLETHGFGRDDVNERSSLHFRKDGSIQVFRERLPAYDHSASRPAERFMCGACNEFRVRYGAGM